MVVKKLLGTFLKMKIKCEDQRTRHNQGFKLMNFEYCENKSVLVIMRNWNTEEIVNFQYVAFLYHQNM